MNRIENTAHEASSRIMWLDWCRVVAIWCVVLCHVMRLTPPCSMDDAGGWGVWINLCYATLFTVSAQGVPLFFCLTGWLLLDRINTFDSAGRFYRRNMLNLFVAAELLFLILFAVEALATGVMPDPERVWKALCFVSSGPNPTCWYIRAILAIYLLLPFMGMVAKRIPARWLWLGLGVLAGATAWHPIADVLAMRGIRLQYIPHHWELVLRGMSYLGYVLLGYLLKGVTGKGLAPALPLAGYVLFTLGAAVFQVVFYEDHLYTTLYFLWYDSPFIFISSACLFLLAAAWGKTGTCGFVQKSSVFSFGIYLVHYPILMGMAQVWGRMTLALIPLAVVVVFLASWVVVFLVDKVPGAGKLLFLIRKPARKP